MAATANLQSTPREAPPLEGGGIFGQGPAFGLAQHVVNPYRGDLALGQGNRDRLQARDHIAGSEDIHHRGS